MPDVRDISIICEELGIYEADLYGSDTNRTTQNNKSKNPFGTDRLYVYFNAYNFRTKQFAPDKYILELEQKQNICKAKFGFKSLFFFIAIINIFIIFVIHKLCMLITDKNYKIAIPITFLIDFLLIKLKFISTRPQIVSYILITLFISIKIQ